MLVQQMRARVSLTQIDSGLNYYGYNQDVIPLLRYQPLVEASQNFVTLAKQAEDDFLRFKNQAEQAEIELMDLQSAIATAGIRVLIEDQRISQTQDSVKQAEIQVQLAKNAVKAKRAEIDDHNSLCGQVKDFFGGMATFFKAVPDFASKPIVSDYSTAFGFGNASAGASAGLGIAGGMALFAVGSEITVSGMCDAANKRVAELQ
jgi:hypothetical protein